MAIADPSSEAPKDQNENHGTVLVGKDMVKGFEEENAEEELHGEWLVVQRKKKGGKENFKGLPLEKSKGISSQSLSAQNAKHVEIHVEEAVNAVKTPHISVDSSKNVSARRSQFGVGKKRARKDSQHGTRTKGMGSAISSPMQNPSNKDVQLNSVPPLDRGNSLSQLGINTQLHDSTTFSFSDKSKPMKGFDLGTEIIISPDLLGSVKPQPVKESGRVGKPLDLRGVKGDQFNATLNHIKPSENMKVNSGFDGLHQVSLGESSKVMASASQRHSSQ
ncbi:hypothetical protein RIF29_39657 [Crotalaria pallida]|uniref:Uncharacterized protein n=1 Tax=Crotalaria pallida TaxID=3830 RepID=A0AAN9HMP4_CROPI